MSMQFRRPHHVVSPCPRRPRQLRQLRARRPPRKVPPGIREIGCSMRRRSARCAGEAGPRRMVELPDRPGSMTHLDTRRSAAPRDSTRRSPRKRALAPTIRGALRRPAARRAALARRRSRRICASRPRWKTRTAPLLPKFRRSRRSSRSAMQRPAASLLRTSGCTACGTRRRARRPTRCRPSPARSRRKSTTTRHGALAVARAARGPRFVRNVLAALRLTLRRARRSQHRRVQGPGGASALAAVLARRAATQVQGLVSGDASTRMRLGANPGPRLPPAGRPC